MVPNPLFGLPPIPHHHADTSRRFYPIKPTDKPNELYHDAINGCSVPGLRLIRNGNSREMLIFIDGACSNSGTPQARAGYGIKWSARNHISERLEGDGPETSNRAELRAAIVALGLRAWTGEGFDKVVLACDSEYVVVGISEWVHDWKKNGWRTDQQSPVENRDLWEMLLAALAKQDDEGVMVQFWLIPRQYNEADLFAKAGTFEERREHMDKIAAFDL
ncbi:hypothetical protein IMSHALPRED_009669 [Imshaugia aleurites]|uniref:ribonuclease H n=1 Tax=Imshaugia aleurites TaxID=172621 RepID=A0A8H3G724_9LECA|nr:hypothetical protein IMSHALPRED_009669 [Imshaugia aleurites]